VSIYRREWLRSDLVAELTTVALVIPKAMASLERWSDADH